jgi:ribosomal protein S18 acetylase RimI-like enzyme
MTVPQLESPTSTGAIELRPFRNSDPPAIVEIWRSQPAQRGLTQPLTLAQLESFVLSKPYFDAEGMIVACENGQPIGFVHAGFGACAQEANLDSQLGVTYVLQTRPAHRYTDTPARLLAAAESYLRSRGAEVLYAGGIRPLNAFYLGLYGGSELPGTLTSDVLSQELFRAHGYQEIDRVAVHQRELHAFRAPIDRKQMSHRRTLIAQATFDPTPRSWWEACTYGCFERKRFELVSRTGGPSLASAMFWTMEPLGHSWGVHAAGLVDLEVNAKNRRQGMAMYLLSEAFKQLHDEGVAVVEVQTMQNNAAAMALYARLGFHIVDHGSVLRKQTATESV